MSFSFTITAANKAEAIAKCEEEVGKIVKAQSSHAHDQVAILSVVRTYLDLLSVDGLCSVSVNGSVGWTGDAAKPDTYTSAGVGVSVRALNKA